MATRPAASCRQAGRRAPGPRGFCRPGQAGEGHMRSGVGGGQLAGAPCMFSTQALVAWPAMWATPSRQRLLNVRCTGPHHQQPHPTLACPQLQVWITPDRRGHEPQYGSSSYEKAERHNKLLHILGGTGAVPAWPGLSKGRCISLHQVSGHPRRGRVPAGAASARLRNPAGRAQK